VTVAGWRQAQADEWVSRSGQEEATEEGSAGVELDGSADDAGEDVSDGSAVVGVDEVRVLHPRRRLTPLLRTGAVGTAAVKVWTTVVVYSVAVAKTVSYEVESCSTVEYTVEVETMMSVYVEVSYAVEKTRSAARVTVGTWIPKRDWQAESWTTGSSLARPATCQRQGVMVRHAGPAEMGLYWTRAFAMFAKTNEMQSD
jgi:hypothetical protein